MLIYKSEMEFDRRDFNADKVKLFEPVRQEMTKIYIHDLLSLDRQTQKDTTLWKEMIILKMKLNLKKKKLGTSQKNT